MDKRAFTGSLLSQLAGAPAATPAAPVIPAAPAAAVPLPAPSAPVGRRLLVIADLPTGEAIPVLQEAYALRRFGFQVEAMVPGDTAARLARYARPGTLLDAQAQPVPQIWEGLEAVLAVPSQDLLARLALGLQDRPAAWLVLQALWRGMAVWMDFSCTECSGGIPCANPAMAALYGGYAAQLRTMGARPVAPGEYLIALRGETAAPQKDTRPPAPTPAPAAGTRTVITQQDLLAHPPSDGIWPVPAGALVTPLARDTAKKLGLELRPEAPSPQAGRSE